MVEDCGERLLEGRRAGDLVAKARALDRQFQQLRTTAKPLTRGLAGAFARKGTRRWLRSLRACRYHAATLARATPQAPAPMQELPSADRLREAVSHVSGNIRALAGVAEDKSPRSIESSAVPIERIAEALSAAGELPKSGHSQPLEILRNLERIDRIVVALAQDFGPIPRRRTR